MPRTRVLITVKTYPTLSGKHNELVCTAGFKEDGSWIRIYPIPFRKKPYAQQYSKYQWIEIDLVKNEKDFRPESFRPHSHDSEITILGEIKPDGGIWKERRNLVLNKVYTELEVLIGEAKNKDVGTSLAVFKPTKIHELIIEPADREWDQDKLDRLRQLNLFESEKDETFEVVRKLPYKFSYRFEDAKGQPATLMIEDWEIGQLYWNCLSRHEGNEHKACEDVRKKYFDDFAKTKDLHLFVGTTLQFHNVAPNPFIIIGTFHPKPITQTELF